MIIKKEKKEPEIKKVDGFANQQHINLIPMDVIDGYDVRPGFYEINGATAIPGGINFTIHF